MSPCEFERARDNDLLDAHTIALPTGGTYRHKQPGIGLVKWTNIDHFTVSNALASLISQP